MCCCFVSVFFLFYTFWNVESQTLAESKVYFRYLHGQHKWRFEITKLFEHLLSFIGLIDLRFAYFILFSNENRTGMIANRRPSPSGLQNYRLSSAPFNSNSNCNNNGIWTTGSRLNSCQMILLFFVNSVLILVQSSKLNFAVRHR